MTDHDVVIVGAGLAGLRAATDLSAAGLDVVVLEARDRVGGRVRSHRFADGQWCERGAEFVDAAHTEVLELAASLGIGITDVPTGQDDVSRLLDVAGRPTPFALNHSLIDELGRWHAALDDLADRVDENDPTATADAEELDRTPLSDLVSSLGLGVLARVAIGRRIRTEYMLGPEEVSQLYAGWMTRLHRASGHESHRLAGGNDRLASGLANVLGARVRLSSAVDTIDAGDDDRSPSATLASGEQLGAGHLIITVPLRVLVRMWPDLPAELASVGYGIGGKFSVQTARRVWRDDGLDGSALSDRAWGELWETTDGQAGDAGVLTALLSSHDGAALVSLPDTADRVVAEMDRLFPGLQSLAGERVQTDWTNDPHSLGAYATFGPGQLTAAWSALRRPHGRLVLAGEHTDRFSGYMEGALRSGARAADLVVRLRSSI